MSSTPAVASAAEPDRSTLLTAAVLLCLALPSVVLLVYDVSADPPARWLPLYWLFGAFVVGMGLPFGLASPYRGLGLVPLAATAWLGAAAYGWFRDHWPGLAHGLPTGLIAGALARWARGPGRAEDTYALAAAVLIGAGLAWAAVIRERPFTLAGFVVLASALALTLWTWPQLLRPVIELALEPPFRLMYRIRCVGPGRSKFPRGGPCLVIANHACWGDPFFLAKDIPRPLTPLMTARFFRPGLLGRLIRLFGIIRVPEETIRRDMPEIREAVAALDRGECVLLFPEGYLRRSEDRPLRRFGQGVWHILKARPSTPVVACWIEGGWGSFASYYNGPPTKNKRPDFRRPITVAVAEPEVVPAEVLADPMRTRVYLMNRVSAARAYAGLEPLPPFELPTAAGPAPED